jgi:3-hydroxyacyl-[acyl-carrier-protein] dehydratase
MAPPLLVDLSRIDLARVVVPLSGIRECNPHRFEMEMLSGIIHIDTAAGEIVAYKDVRADEFWVRGHIPGRPIFPGVLMIETAAQLVSYYVMSEQPEKGFMGFGGVEGVKFRGAITPGHRIEVLGKMLEMRSRRCVGATQAFVDGEMVFEGLITGMWL